MQRIGFTVTDRIVNDVQGKFFFSGREKIHARIHFSYVKLAFLMTRCFGTDTVMFGNTKLNRVLKYQVYMNIHT